ncbi:hypothetical protein DINM_000088 [Dirofilaria immitis]|nr:hypothetical protein [Dirofilaria immitis]
MSSNTNSHILIPVSSQYKTVQTSSQVNGQGIVNHSSAGSYLRLSTAETKRKNRRRYGYNTSLRFHKFNTLQKSHPLVYPRLRIYPGLRISRLHITWANSFEDITRTKHIILNVGYAGEHSKQIFHILYYIRSMVEKGEAEGWTRIYSKECEASGNSRLRIQFDEGQTWFNDAIYFTGFIECGLERYGAYADVCKVELGLQDKRVFIL